jgi:uncharacterized membrane protein
MSDLVPVFLTIHVLTAIVAFGPTFAFPLMARMAAREPQHGLFVLRLTDRIERTITIPLALTMPISGALLVWAEGIQLADAHWLVLAIVLYLVAMTYSIVVQVRTLDRMIEIAEGLAAGHAAPALTAAPIPAAADAPTAAPQPAFAAGPGAALATPETLEAGREMGSAAEMARLGARVRNGGMFLALMVFLIVSLMAGKPAI